MSDRYDMNQSVKDLLVAEKTKMVRKKKKQVFEARDQITADRQQPFRHRLKTLQDAKREVNIVEQFQSLLLPNDQEDGNVLGSVPQPLFRSHVSSKSSPNKAFTVHERNSTSRQQQQQQRRRRRHDQDERNYENTITTTFDEKRQSDRDEKTFHEMRRNLEEAKNAKIVQQDMLSKKRAVDNVFKPYVPIPRINHQGRFDQTIDVARMYLHHLEIFSDPEIVFNQNRFTQHALDSFVFLDKHWKRIIEDLHAGTLHPALPLSAEDRRSYLSRAKPRPHEALQAEKYLKQLGFHRRLLVSEANFDLKLFRQTKNDDLPLILENAMHKSRSGMDGRSGGSSSGSSLPDILLSRTQSGLSKSSGRSNRSCLVRRRKRAVPVIRAAANNDEALRLTWPRKVPWRMTYDEKMEGSPWSNTSV